MKNFIKTLSFMLVVLCPQICLATASGELYTSAAYSYGRFETRARFAAGDGVVSSFFLWKPGSEQAGAFWNELDFEKVGANCQIQTNAIYGNPSTNHNQTATTQVDICGAYHTLAYEWTPTAVVWLIDGVEIRRETGAIPTAFAQNASTGMQLHFNLWPGDASFGGDFKPSILPVHEYLDWVQYSAYKDGAFTVTWRQDFNATTAPDAWLTGNWASPKSLSTNTAQNVNFLQGAAVLSLTTDNALGPTGAMPGTSIGGAGGAGSGGSGGSSGMAGSAGKAGSGGAGGVGAAGSPGAAGSLGAAGSPGAAGSLGAAGSFGAGGTGGAAALGGATGVAGAAGNPALPGSAGAPSGAVNTAGAANGAAPTSNGGSSCSFGRFPVEGAGSWAMCLLAMGFLRRRARRRQAA